NMSAIALMEAGLDEIIAMKYQNVDDMIHINENNAVSELNKNETEINNTNVTIRSEDMIHINENNTVSELNNDKIEINNTN
ncbi:23743_t:CDS:2, partial [Gigaspora rosea]